MKKNTTIREDSRVLVEKILNGDLLDANTLLEDLINKIEQKREKKIASIVLEQEGDDADADAELDAEADLDEDAGDDTEGTEEGEETEGTEEGAGEIGDDEAELGETLGDEEADAEGQVTDGKLDEMTSVLTGLNHKLNKAKISKLYDKISTLKSQLNAMNLDKDDLEYVELDAKLGFYSEALENLQQKSMPGVDGEENDEIAKNINIIYQALNTLESEIQNGNGEENEDAMKTTEDLDEEESEESEESEEGEEELSEEEEGEESEEEIPEEEEGEESEEEEPEEEK